MQALLGAVALQELLDASLLTDQCTIWYRWWRETVLYDCLLVDEREVIALLPIEIIEFPLALHIWSVLGESHAGLLLTIVVYLRHGRHLLLCLSATLPSRHPLLI